MAGKISFSVICLFLFVMVSSAYDGPVGIQNLERFDLLPKIKTGVRCLEYASTDKTGGNADAAETVYQDTNGEYVLFDAIGPGCIYRMWMAIQGEVFTFKFYFDGETTPRINILGSDFFSGTTAPFLFPMAGYSAGGRINYYPFPFKKSLKITCSDLGAYHHIDYHMYDNDNNVVTYTGTEDTSKVMAMFKNCGTDPKSTAGNIIYSNTASINNSQSAALFNQNGPGEIESIKLKLSAVNTQILQNSWLRIYWDGETNPSVNSPLGEFFGNAINSANSGTYSFYSLPIGMGTTCYYCYFPMPYNGSARVEIYNNTGQLLSNLWYEIQYKNLSSAQADVGYFYATHHEEKPNTFGKDYNFLTVSGRGHYLGNSIFFDCIYYPSNLEGDHRFYEDEALAPSHYGTGSEDYYNCGWYFTNAPVAMPYNGYSNQCAFRLHIPDFIPFNNCGKFGMEVGANNDMTANYMSTAFYYLQHSSGMVLTDTLDVGNSGSETSHNYSVSGSLWNGTNSFYYEGDNDDILVTDNGREHNGSSQFTVTIDPNNDGVILRRRLDQDIGPENPNYWIADNARQAAAVSIDGVQAGTWYTAMTNKFKRWLDSEYQIPKNYTFGKNSITIKLDFILLHRWSEYYYWVYSIKPLTTQQGLATKLIVTANPGTMYADGSNQSNITASICDANGYVVPLSSLVTFSWTGPGSLTAPLTKNAVNGVASITYTAGTVPGTAVITAASQGLAQGTVSITLTTPPQPQISVLSPNGGETWTQGTTNTVIWTSQNVTGNVDIDISFNGASGPWTTLKSATANDGTEAVAVPTTLSTTCMIRVKDVSGTPLDVSDGNFTITNTPTPILTIDKTSIDFGSITQGQSGTNTLNITNSGAGTLTGAITSDRSWITIAPAQFQITNSGSQITVSVNTTGLTPGPNTGTVTVTSNGGNATVNITVNVTIPPGQDPHIALSTTSLNFGELDLGSVSQPQAFNIKNDGQGTLTGTISVSDSWITIDKTSLNLAAQAEEQVTVSVDNSLLAQKEGPAKGEITITSNGNNGAQVTTTISVEFTATCVLVKPNPFSLSSPLAGEGKGDGCITFYGDGIVPGKTTIKIYTLSGTLVFVIPASEPESSSLSLRGALATWQSQNEISWTPSNLYPGIYLYVYESPREKGIGKLTIIK